MNARASSVVSVPGGESLVVRRPCSRGAQYQRDTSSTPTVRPVPPKGSRHHQRGRDRIEALLQV